MWQIALEDLNYFVRAMVLHFRANGVRMYPAATTRLSLVSRRFTGGPTCSSGETRFTGVPGGGGGVDGTLQTPPCAGLEQECL